MARGDVLKLVVSNIPKVETVEELNDIEFNVVYSIADNRQPGRYSTDYQTASSMVGMDDLMTGPAEDRSDLIGD